MIGRSNAVSGGGIEWKDGARVSGAAINIPLFPYNGETIMLKWEIPGAWEDQAMLPIEINSATAYAFVFAPGQGVFATTASLESLNLTIRGSGDMTTEIELTDGTRFPKGAMAQYAIAD